MKQKAEGMGRLRITDLIDKVKDRLTKIPQGYLEWAVVLSVVAGFSWLQIEILQIFRSGAAGVILALAVLTEMIVLVTVNRLFL
jgi:hypothetical protein